MNRIVKTLVNILAFGLAGLGVCALQYRQFQALTDRNGLDVAAEQARVRQEALSLKTLKYIPGFGFDALVADWTLLKFFDYFGDDPARNVTDYSLAPNYFDVILDRDPYFWEAYFFMSGASTLYAGRPDRTVALFNEHLPKLGPTTPRQAYLLWSYKATDELLFLADSEAAKQSYAMGVDWAEANGSPEALIARDSYRDSIKFLEADPHSRPAQISAWDGILINALDRATQALAVQKIQELGGQVIFDEDGSHRVVIPKG